MAEIVGIRNVKFQGNNGQISGISLYYTEDAYGVEGKQTGKVFLSDNLLQRIECPHVGDFVEFQYNKYGKVVSINIIYV